MINSSCFDDKKVSRDLVYGSKDWANHKLKFCIRLLKGEVCKSSDGNLAFVLAIKKDLLEYGYSWQACRVDNWIHRLHPKGDFSREKEASL